MSDGELSAYALEQRMPDAERWLAEFFYGPRARRPGFDPSRMPTLAELSDHERALADIAPGATDPPSAQKTMGRIATPERMIGVTDFSKTPEVNSPTFIVRMLRQLPWVYDELRAKAEELQTPAGNGNAHGRPRKPGEWPLAYMAFLVSRIPDLQPWFNQTTDEIWIECGFERKPSYGRAYERMTELEQIVDAFTEAAGAVMRHCREQEPRIGQHVHWDSTEAETHAALVHVCCRPANGRKRQQRAIRPKRLPTADEREHRQAKAEEPPPERPGADLGDADKVRMQNGKKQFRIRDHWYETSDKTAGIRAYAGPRQATKFWHGFYNQKAVDHFTGGLLAIHNYNASEQEYYCYPDLFAQLERNLGRRPQSIVADRGFSIASVFEHNTKRGVATVVPFRKNHWTGNRRHDCETHDRHGIPRCKHCGGETSFVRFSANNGKPRLWVRCLEEATPACKKVQTISCQVDWKGLLPLWRTDPTYQELRASHEHYERIHDDVRQRYVVAGDNRSTRPKRRGIEWQNLRSAAALLAEWLRIGYREGWLGLGRTSCSEIKKPNNVGKRNAGGLKRYREKKGLCTPYGQAAHQLGLGPLLAPSELEQAHEAADELTGSAAAAALPSDPGELPE